MTDVPTRQAPVLLGMLSGGIESSRSFRTNGTVNIKECKFLVRVGNKLGQLVTSLSLLLSSEKLLPS